MQIRFRGWQLLECAACLALLAGCEAAKEQAATAPSGDQIYLLESEPAGAGDVKQVRADAKDAEEVTVVGRIGGEVNPWIEGQAAFLIVDRSLKPCNERDDDSCETPWDYCCDTDTLPENKLLVKVVDSSGKPIRTDARKLLAVAELQTVVVRGTAKRDDGGNVTVLADGVFVRK